MALPASRAEAREAGGTEEPGLDCQQLPAGLCQARAIRPVRIRRVFRGRIARRAWGRLLAAASKAEMSAQSVMRRTYAEQYRSSTPKCDSRGSSFRHRGRRAWNPAPSRCWARTVVETEGRFSANCRGNAQKRILFQLLAVPESRARAKRKNLAILNALADNETPRDAA